MLVSLLYFIVKYIYFNPLSANPTKWSNTLKQIIGKLPKNCLSVFDHFVWLALKGLKQFVKSLVVKYTYSLTLIFPSKMHQSFFRLYDVFFIKHLKFYYNKNRRCFNLFCCKCMCIQRIFKLSDWIQICFRCHVVKISY